jgi:hypothetical protein
MNIEMTVTFIFYGAELFRATMPTNPNPGESVIDPATGDSYIVVPPIAWTFVKDDFGFLLPQATCRLARQS